LLIIVSGDFNKLVLFFAVDAAMILFSLQEHRNAKQLKIMEILNRNEYNFIVNIHFSR